MNRRGLLIGTARFSVLAVAGKALWPNQVWAQAATPAPNSFASGLPEISIAVDDSGFTVPDGVVSGRSLMTVHNTGSKELHFFVIRVPDEVSDEQVMSDLTSAGEEDPAWFDMAKLPMIGNPDWPAPGATARGVVDLGEGRWVLIDPIDFRAPALLRVAQGTTQPEPDVTADVSIEMIDMDFIGLDEPLAAGPQVWKIANTGALFHEIAILAIPTGATNDSIMAGLGSMLQGTPTPEFAEFAPLCGQGIASAGVTSWQLFDLPVGEYAAICMSPTIGAENDFTPHALMGMVKVFTVQ